MSISLHKSIIISSDKVCANRTSRAARAKRCSHQLCRVAFEVDTVNAMSLFIAEVPPDFAPIFGAKLRNKNDIDDVLPKYFLFYHKKVNLKSIR